MSKEIVVKCDKRVVSYINGRLEGDADLIAQVELAGQVKHPTVLIPHTTPVEASLDDKDDLVAVTAAMLNASKSAELIKAPQSVIDYYAELSEYNEEYVY